MNFLIIDGNSIINRAFYGIKLLNAKDGHFTNAIYGFFNIFLNLIDNYKPGAVAVAFDVKHPTFRHEMYSEYKAGRKPMPSELYEQMEPLKKLLTAYGAHIIECPGFEADDILGTLSSHTPSGSHCYIATGDRDSLQLVKDNVSVLLTSTKFGKTQTIEYTPDKIMDEYGVIPSGMIEIKALQGDSSDNIPGVAGIGPKTAGELIKKYGSIDNLYENIDGIEATVSVKNKLINGKDSAYFSRILGTINLDAPIESNMECYVLNECNNDELKAELIYHEMFKTVSRLNLDTSSVEDDTGNKSIALCNINATFRNAGVWELEELKKQKKIYLYPDVLKDNKKLYIYCNDTIYYISDFSVFTQSALLTLLADNNTEKYIFDSKQLYKYCFNNNVDLNNVAFDIKLAAYLLAPEASTYELKSLAMEYKINPAAIEYSDESECVQGEEKEIAEYIPAMPVLCNKLQAVLEEREQTELLKNIEIPLAEVLADMENQGIAVSPEDISKYSEILNREIDTLRDKIYIQAGEEFNINSPKQLGVILFEKMQIPCKKKTKTGYSTSAEVLEELSEEYPVVADILEYRTYSKLKSTYCDGLLNAVDKDGRVRCTFNQTETRTGRLSSTEPNLQNIPVRTKAGREFRKFFIAEKGNVIVDADYSQIELRVLAALSQDKNMTEAFNSNVDIHSVTASKVFGVDLSDVTSELRSKAKAVNFGIVYGIGAFSLAKNIKSSRQEADAFIKSYLSLYSSVKKYMDECIVSAKEKGFSETIFKRRRYLPELNSSNHMMKAFGERVARNMPIQGTAADIIKIAMINVYRRLKKDFPDSRLIMQVHDELMIETPEKDAEVICELIKAEMENAVKLSVCMSVDAHYGRSWYEAKG